eukprot:TRINITY_DN1347_c0_g8_i1.p1 TRINITY_DN1347_c0_g8~~TRINITY_DN1347_c0_g8_i1.p1  ORF type:complete len:575 (-),score=160.17 TRINITY_DN1347_c0_g8_i1:82-1806(-)
MASDRWEGVVEFFDIPSSESVRKDVFASANGSILFPGKLFLTSKYICFFSNVLGIRKTKILISLKDVQSMEFETLWMGLVGNFNVTLQTGVFSFSGLDVSGIEELYDEAKKGKEELDEAAQAQAANLVPEAEGDGDSECEDEAVPEPESIATPLSEDFKFLDQPECPSRKQVIELDIPNATVRQVFDIFLGDPSFTKAFHESCKEWDVDVGPWVYYGKEHGALRKVFFRKEVAMPIGTKKTRVFIIHRYILLDGIGFRFEINGYSADVPYGDSFRFESFWTFKKSGLSVHVTVDLQVRFLKSVYWKGKIEKGVFKEAPKTYMDMLDVVKRKCRVLQRTRSMHKKADVEETEMSTISSQDAEEVEDVDVRSGLQEDEKPCPQYSKLAQDTVTSWNDVFYFSLVLLGIFGACFMVFLFWDHRLTHREPSIDPIMMDMLLQATFSSANGNLSQYFAKEEDALQDQYDGFSEVLLSSKLNDIEVLFPLHFQLRHWLEIADVQEGHLKSVQMQAKIVSKFLQRLSQTRFKQSTGKKIKRGPKWWVTVLIVMFVAATGVVVSMWISGSSLLRKVFSQTED